VRTNTNEIELQGARIGSFDEEDGQKSTKKTQNLFFLHGLMSKGQNWRSFALNDVISSQRNMHLLDLRNHGDSDHHASMTYEEMANDVIRYADQREIDKLAVIGHNIGAKTAMTLSCMYPDRISALICLDTMPLSFRNPKG